MNAQKWAFYIFCFVIAAGIVNTAEIFEVTIPEPTVTIPSADLDEGIEEINSGISSTDDTTSSFDSGEMILNMLSTVKTLFTVLIIPGPYLLGIGVPASIAIGVQSLASLTEAWGLMQLVSGRSTHNMD